MMLKKADRMLLKDPEVLLEIERFKWIESERAGHDIGIETAANEWLDLYASTWRLYHPSQARTSTTLKKGRRKK